MLSILKTFESESQNPVLPGEHLLYYCMQFDISETLNERDGICVTQYDQYQQNTRAVMKY